MDVATAYDIAAKWHDKNYRGCLLIADDYARVGADVAASAKAAAKHHAASAAGLRIAAVELRSKALATAA